ncbi:hypothetical protein [Hymenobacter sp. BT730]|uniref:hypothetical protein n=1 Tax=Hymenobacter sp. BT730 TaxID=3063332 RepID=UPI0026E06A7A|nr:hypothetical protein [Hymenobacter sp. BT730]
MTLHPSRARPAPALSPDGADREFVQRQRHDSNRLGENTFPSQVNGLRSLQKLLETTSCHFPPLL